ncbi:MAG: YbaN family protein [Myxococcales bacterium]|nr:YbaN family protein [Myxococcales bacterium]
MAWAPVRWLYLLLGWVFFALGVAGVILPAVPATPFMLLALWAWSRSSPRLEAWLLAHRVFGPTLRAWQAHRVISWKAKAVAWVSMAASLIYLLFVRQAAWWILAITVAVMAYGVWFMARCPSRAPSPPTPASG